MRHPGLFSILMLVLLALVVGQLEPGSDRSRPQGEGAQAEAVPRQALPGAPGLFIFGNDQGMLRPCGCAKPVLGGIVRRGAFFSALPESVRRGSVVVAAGNIIKEGGRQQELKVESFLDAMAQMGVQVFCPLDGDTLVGSAFWREFLEGGSKPPFPLVSLNLYQGGQPLFQSHAVVSLGGEDIVVTSLVSPDDNVMTEPGLEARRDPDLTALLAALEQDGRRRPLLVVGSAPVPVLREQVEALGLSHSASKVMLAVAGHSDLPVIDLDEENLLGIEIGQKGRDVAWLSWPRSHELTHYTLTDAWGEDEEQGKILDYYRSNVKFEELILQVPRFEEAEGQYAGSDACATCHQSAHATWAQSRHAHAFDSLKRSGDQWDPECVRCHVVDFDLLGGFDPAAMEPRHVQCEACHGPSQDHIERQLPTPRGRLGESFCFKCHDLANSPDFDFGVYWPLIRHGR